MKTEYRIIATATFDTVEERDKAYDTLKTFMMGVAKSAAVYKRADLTRDEYLIPDNATVSEKVI